LLKQDNQHNRNSSLPKKKKIAHENVILEKSFKFALKIIEYSELLEETKNMLLPDKF